jgi:flagellar biosynthetic protein FliQ
MTGAAILDIARDGIVTFLKVAAPLMLVALLIGFVVSLLQALTQIQEQTLIYVPKIIAVFAFRLYDANRGSHRRRRLERDGFKLGSARCEFSPADRRPPRRIMF